MYSVTWRFGIEKHVYRQWFFSPLHSSTPETYLPNPDLWQAKYCVSTKGGNWAIAMFKVKFLWWVNLLFYEPTLQLMNLNHIFVCSVIVLTHIVIWVGLNLEYRQILIAYQFIIICASKIIKIAIWTYTGIRYSHFSNRSQNPWICRSGRRATPLLCSKAIAAQQQLPASTCSCSFSVFLGSWVPSGNLT